MGKSAEAFRTISEVADWLGIPTHVLRFWESKFAQIKPIKRAGGRRYYRPNDMLLIGGIRKLLHEDGMTIKGAQKILREKGVKYVAALSQQVELAPNFEADITQEPNDHPPREAGENNVVMLDQNEATQDIAGISDEQDQQSTLNFWQAEDANAMTPHDDPIVATSAGLIAAIDQISPITEMVDGPLHIISAELKAQLARRRAGDHQ